MRSLTKCTPQPYPPGMFALQLEYCSMLWPDGTLYREQVNVSTHLLAGCCLPLGEGISDTISTRRHTELVSVCTIHWSFSVPQLSV